MMGRGNVNRADQDNDSSIPQFEQASMAGIACDFRASSAPS
jgi:hypothetical protein